MSGSSRSSSRDRRQVTSVPKEARSSLKPSAAFMNSNGILIGNEGSPVCALTTSTPTTSTLFITCPNSRYVRQGRIGKGAFKEVYRAMDEEEGMEVAWSEIDFSQCISRSKMIREVELLMKLHHPHIIRCHSSWEDTQRQCLVFVTELMTSGTLADFITQQSTRALKHHAIVKYGRQILRGLAYLHSKDVIHRDLKCSNIFINGNKGEVKIGDLGVSIAGRHANSVIGTPEYMAPEMFGEHYTNAIDVWSFGLCLLEMSTGSRPYAECDNIGQIYKKVSLGVLPSLEGIEDTVVLDVVRRCLAVDPQERPTAEQLLQSPPFGEDGSDGGSSSWDNDSMVGRSVDLSVLEKMSLIEWLRVAPATVRSDVIHFALSRLWIDSKDAETIALATTARPSIPLPFSFASENGRSCSASSMNAATVSLPASTQQQPSDGYEPSPSCSVPRETAECSLQRNADSVNASATGSPEHPPAAAASLPHNYSHKPPLVPTSAYSAGSDEHYFRAQGGHFLDCATLDHDDGATTSAAATPKGAAKTPQHTHNGLSQQQLFDPDGAGLPDSETTEQRRKAAAQQSEQKLLAQFELFLPPSSNAASSGGSLLAPTPPTGMHHYASAPNLRNAAAGAHHFYSHETPSVATGSSYPLSALPSTLMDEAHLQPASGRASPQGNTSFMEARVVPDITIASLQSGH